MGEAADGLSRVVAIFGFRRGSTVVSIYVNGKMLQGGGKGVTLVSNPSRRAYEMWWAANLELPDETPIMLRVKVGVKGAGPDRERSCENTYLVDAASSTHEVNIHKIGHKGYPLLKGPLKIILEQSEQQEIDAQLEEMLENT